MVLVELSTALPLLEFLIKNPNEWFTVRDISNRLGWNLTKVYTVTGVINDKGFIHRRRRKGFGNSLWVKLNNEATQTEILIGLYKELKQ